MSNKKFSINRHAQALGRLGKGRKKTMTKAAIQQRQDAIKRALAARKQTNILRSAVHFNAKVT